MYRRTVSRRFTQMNVHFLLMNIKRCNPPPPRSRAPLTRVSKALQELACGAGVLGGQNLGRVRCVVTL